MVDLLFDQYDRGRMTRRHLVQALAALVLRTPALAQDGAPASGPIVRGLSVNHVALTVSDVPRSFAFYERLNKDSKPTQTSPHVHQPLIQTIVDELLGGGTCSSTGETGARTSWVMDRCLTNYYG